MNINDIPAAAFDNEIPSGIPGGFFIYNALDNEELVYADQNVIELFGCTNMEDFRELTHNSFRGMVHPDDLERVENSILTQTFNSGRMHDYVRYRIVTKQGTNRFVEDFGHLMRGNDGKTYYYVFIVDVEQSRYEDQDQQSFAEMQVFKANKKIDRLTGLLNMDAFYEKAKGILLDRAVEGEHPSTVIVFDILGLRDINRMLGHAEGDSRIRVLADIINKNMPEDSFVFRGHEADLVVVCKNKSERDVMDNIAAVVNACKSPILFGVGTAGENSLQMTYTDEGTMLQALEEAHLDLKIKKMLNVKSERSQTLASLVRALEAVDSDTEAHVQRTQKMGLALGRRIGLSDYQLTLLQLLCLLHDIGKIAVPLEILNKPGRLTREEWAVLRSHTEKGYQIARATEELKPIADVILYHHERWDGKGYPEGLSKEEIPVLSRVISVVDAYDAMVNDRCYRKGMIPEKAMKEIRDNAGTQFDPYIAVEFLNMLEENPSLSVGTKIGGEVRVFSQIVAQSAGVGETRPVAYSQYTLDLDDTIIEVDDSFEALTGYSPEDVIGKMKQYDLIPEDEMKFYAEQVQLQFTHGNIAYLRHPLKRKDGAVIHVICNGERYFDSSVRAFRSAIMMFEVS